MKLSKVISHHRIEIIQSHPSFLAHYHGYNYVHNTTVIYRLYSVIVVLFAS